jgi:large subunit ribosomal protein L5e
LEGIYKKAHDAIRADPSHPKKETKKPAEQKRWNAKKFSLRERKHRVANKKAYLLHLKNVQEQQVAQAS